MRTRAGGVVEIPFSPATAGLKPPIATGPRAWVLQILFVTIIAIVGSLPQSSEQTMERALRYLQAFLSWFGAALPTGWIIAAYIVMRVAPPLGIPIPAFILRGIVRQNTVQNEISALRRYLKLRANTPRTPESKAWDDALAEALDDPIVSSVLHALATPRQKKTKKLPILFSMVLALWAAISPSATRYCPDFPAKGQDPP